MADRAKGIVITRAPRHPRPTHVAGEPRGAAGPLWHDSWAVWLAVLGLVLDAAFASYLWNRLPFLPNLLPMHFNAMGEVDLIVAKQDVLRLPIIAAIIWGSNVVLALIVTRFDRILARLLLGTAALVQLLFGIAALRLIN